MQKYSSILFFVFLIGLSLFGCANQGQLTGGKKDTTPPILDTLNSTPNYQTNFQKQPIELTFNEWLQLKDAFSQVVVSPPLEKGTKVTLKKKTVRFEFDEQEVLRENATYTINFGECVQDLTERNPVEDLRFVFSTGDFIDSLEVHGAVVDALDKKPVKDVLVMLYDNLADSVVRKELPLYFAKTDEEGHFDIRNVRADTFKVFALFGSNNYKFDNDQEKIGFMEEPIIVTDSTEVDLALQIFQEAAPLQLQDEDKKKYGKVAFSFNRKPQAGETKITFQEVGQKTYQQFNRDSILLWYDLPQDTTWKVYVATDTVRADTIKIAKISKLDFLAAQKLTLAKPIAPKTKTVVNPSKPLSIAFNFPLENFDTSLISILVDTLLQKATPNVKIDSTDRRNLLVQFPFKEKTPYQLQILPNALTDFFGQKNDTLTFDLDIKSKNEFGDLTLTVVNMQMEQAYVMELLDKGDAIIETIPMSGDTIFIRKFTAIPTGKYSVRMIKDDNGNGRWDTGNYDKKAQPESLFTRPLEEVRAGWEVAATVSADEKVSVKKAPTAPKADSEKPPKPNNPKPKGPKPNKKN